mmetsp:Transcript_27690/g.60684  ORF Transcript_27690/g.60684 Transcript_27690/m.60684 type:complete len:194 (-) Transcript_27690:215-796(-)
MKRRMSMRRMNALLAMALVVISIIIAAALPTASAAFTMFADKDEDDKKKVSSKDTATDGYDPYYCPPDTHATLDIYFAVSDEAVIIQDAEISGSVSIKAFVPSGRDYDVLDDNFSFTSGQPGIVFSTVRTYTRSLCLSVHYCYFVDLTLETASVEVVDYSVLVRFDGEVQFSSLENTGIPALYGAGFATFGSC